jgi:hypothetical protein
MIFKIDHFVSQNKKPCKNAIYKFEEKEVKVYLGSWYVKGDYEETKHYQTRIMKDEWWEVEINMLEELMELTKEVESLAIEIDNGINYITTTPFEY